MKLHDEADLFTFDALQRRLIAFVNDRVRNGEFSERGLAALLGVSQPHLHNVLKGERKLHTQLADILLTKFGISVIDLLTAAEYSPLLHNPDELAPDAEMTRLRSLRKRPASYNRPDRSEWSIG